MVMMAACQLWAVIMYTSESKALVAPTRIKTKTIGNVSSR
jgi:hypothetical protein